MENSCKLNLPSWYEVEKETGKTINKLTDSKELSFYLQNPDPYIRRLAILRVGQLKRKDSYVLLSTILDDKLETEENRELAALMMQKLNRDLGLGFFISNQYLSRFTGEENIDKLLNINVIDTFPDISFHFENALIESQLNFDNEFLKSNMDEKAIEFPFSFKDWLSHCSAGILLDIKKGCLKLLRFLFIQGPKKFFSWVASIPKRIGERKMHREESESCFTDDSFLQGSGTKKMTVKRKRAQVYRPPLSSVIKGFVHKLLNIFFAPFRILWHFKWVILMTLAVMYGLFSFTQSGRSFLFRINPDAYYLNLDFWDKSKRYVLTAVNENETLSAVFGASQTPTLENPDKEPADKLKVTAPKGLYLRSEPVSTGKKVVLMKVSTIVEYLGEEKQDSSGNKWLKIRVDEKTTGWANSEWLGEV